MEEEDKKKKILEQLAETKDKKKNKDKKKKILEQLANMPAWSLAILLSSISILAAPFIYFLIIRHRAKNKKEKNEK